MADSRARARLVWMIGFLVWPPGGLARAQQPVAGPQAPPAGQPAPVPAPPAPNDPWLSPPPGYGGPAPGTPTGTAADDPRLFVAGVAAQRGLNHPALLASLERYYRSRRIGLQTGVPGSYQFIVGEPGRVVAEHQFIDSYRIVTGSSDLDRFAPDRSGRVLAGILTVGGGLTAYVAGLVALGCASLGNSQERDSARCSPGVPAAIAVGGAVAGIAGLVTLSRSGPPVDPNLHRIPLTTAQTIVPVYNRALVERAILELQRGNPGYLEASLSPPGRRREPPRPRTSVGLGPGGFLVRF
jgi:hypothetical protein